MAVSITPVVAGAAINGPPPPAPSMYRKAICLPSCDQRGRAAYPVRFVIFFASEASFLTVQSCRWPLSPLPEKNASVFESGDQARSKSFLSPVVGSLTGLEGRLPEVSPMYVCLEVVAAVDCTHAKWAPSGERATSPYKTVLPSCCVNSCMF